MLATRQQMAGNWGYYYSKEGAACQNFTDFWKLNLKNSSYWKVFETIKLKIISRYLKLMDKKIKLI